MPQLRSQPQEDEELIKNQAKLLFTRPPGRPLEVWQNVVRRTGISLIKKRPRSPLQLQPLDDHKTPRRMRSYVQNFLADELGTFRSEIDMYQHAIDSGKTVTDSDVQEVARLLPALKTLRLSHCTDVSDASLWAVAKHCPNLTGIYMRRCERITDLGLRVLSHNCRLITVDLSECTQIGDLALATLAAGCWMIETFLLARCPNVTDAGIAKIAQCCKGLTYIDVSECQHVGEFGDKALSELGRQCKNLKHLDLFGCRHVRDMGIQAIAKGCPQLTTLKLTGCRDVSSLSIKELALLCHELTHLSLAGCVKTKNDDLILLSQSCRKLVWLDISGSPTLSNKGIAALAKNCQALEHLNLSDCQHISDKVLQTIGAHLGSLTSLSLVNCPRITEDGIDTLTEACKKLFTLNMTNCPHIRRRYLHELIDRLEFVDWSNSFFGIEPLPNAMELQLKKERRILEVKSAIKIQAVMRGCLARGGVYGARLRRIERTVLPKIQARVRGYLARVHYNQLLHSKLQFEMAKVIQRAYRQCAIRRMCRRARRLLRIRNDQEAAAIIFQKIFRGHRARKYVAAIRAKQYAHAQLKARKAAMLELAAIKVQRLYRGHKGRGDIAFVRKMRELARLQAEKEKKAASVLQRIYRGHVGRKDYHTRLEQFHRLQEQYQKATKMQSTFRQFQKRKQAKIIAAEEAEEAKLRAVVCIQKNWRGAREKHLTSIMFGLVQLRRREDQAARVIQSRCRAYMSRGLLKAMKAVLMAKERREKGAFNIQRVFRGHKGRELKEVKVALLKLESQAKPLYLRIEKYDRSVQELSASVAKSRSALTIDQADEVAIAAELEKTMTIKSKFHDSARITGAKQRYLTRYLQTQLADQLQKKRMLVAVETRNLEVAVAELNESEKQLRFAKRELQPLTEGVERKTKANRTNRLQLKVRAERKGAIALQRLFRGYRVRAAVCEGSSRWIELYDPALDVLYYYNAWSQEKRRVRPLAMDIFGDKFVPPYQGTSWYQCHDEFSQSFYYYNRDTQEYRWEPPNLDSSVNQELFITDSIALTSRSIKTRDIGTWEEHIDPETNTTFYYNPATGESSWTLPPTVAYSDRQSTGRRSVRSLNRLNAPVAWQYYYGYELNEQNELVKSKSARSPWIECFDEYYQMPYYYNQLTEECRWTKPDDFDTPVIQATTSPGMEWYDSQDKKVLSSRESTTRQAIGTAWEERQDVDTGYIYYYNSITGETRWSLSPRSAREDELVGPDHMPLVLQDKLQAWRDTTNAILYENRDVHAAWLQEAIDAKEWQKAEGILAEIVWREQDSSYGNQPMYY
ncbi:hypothetical protein THRCLA_07525 [Thraustotheca clavata]|uniref:WW domain-containing protein n=1 Tax=Thraustotheca clavata TaxID=74557 RepID=A0A1V9ZDB6_9STRA|nr:hypothetical protein THRCLA_07525 [Thraustotheca clavata]